MRDYDAMKEEWDAMRAENGKPPPEKPLPEQPKGDAMDKRLPGSFESGK